MGCFGEGNSRGDRKRLLDMDEKDRSVGTLGEGGVQWCEKSERGGRSLHGHLELLAAAQ